jgi:hypothetical protein
MNSSVELEHEVEPRVDDRPVIRGYLLRHAFIHFGIVFCLWYTCASLLDHFLPRLLHWQPQSEGWVLGFSFLMSVIFYATQRRRFSSHTSRD